MKKEFDMDTYNDIKTLVIEELIEELIEDEESAEEIGYLIQNKMLDGGERDHFMKHLIEAEKEADKCTERILYLRSQLPQKI